jgi:hypothetical protein
MMYRPTAFVPLQSIGQCLHGLPGVAATLPIEQLKTWLELFCARDYSLK